MQIDRFYKGAYTKYVQQLYRKACSYYNNNQLFDLNNKDDNLFNLDNNKKDSLNNVYSNASVKIKDIVIDF